MVHRLTALVRLYLHRVRGDHPGQCTCGRPYPCEVRQRYWAADALRSRDRRQRRPA